jgi:hypothetical protein
MKTKEEIKEDYLKEVLSVLVERSYCLGRLDARHDLKCDPTQLNHDIDQIIEAVYGE